MKPKVYLETSFVSYLSGRLSEDLTTLQRQLSSQRWWEQERHKFDLVVSQTVDEERARGNEQAVQGRSAILQETTLLPLTREILEVAKRLVYPGPFPRKAEARCASCCRGNGGRLRVFANLEFQAHQQRADEARCSEDHRRVWVPTSNHLHPRRTHGI